MNQSTLMGNENQLDKRVFRRLAPWVTALAFVVTVLSSPSAAFALITDFPSWEVASEFNDGYNTYSSNPSGVWSYGEKPSTFGSLALFSIPFAFGSPVLTSGWTNYAGYPLVFHNVNSIPVNVSNSTYTVTLPPHALVLHPGYGSYAVVRFTVLYTGSYKISGQFYALDDNRSWNDN